MRSSSAGASAAETPNFESGLPVSIAACVLPCTAGVDAQEHALVRGADALEAVDVVGVVDHDQPHAGGDRVAEVAVGLRVAVQQDAMGVEARGQRDRQLAGGRDVAAEALLGEDARHRRAGQRLGREVHVGVGVQRPERLEVLARRVAQAPLVEHQRGRAELGRDVGQRAAADGQAAVVVDAGGARQDHGRAVWARMDVDVFTLFPHWFDWFRTQRHVANVLALGHTFETVDYRATTPLKGGRVDDVPFGGGAGMVLRVDVVEAALRARYGERSGRRSALAGA